jgi:hypothetical protein
MTTAALPLLRSLAIYGICVPLALLLGYLISTPFDPTSFTVVGLVLFFLLVPLLLRWHHAWLIASWNMTVVIFFLPGHPMLWLTLAWISLGISMLHYILNRNRKFLYVPELTKPLILLALVALVTAKFTGGFGVKAFGSDTFGGKRYLMILTSIAGYFAITSQRIPPRRVPLYLALYLLGPITLAVGELAVVANPAFYFIFLIFPIGETGLQAIAGGPAAPTGFGDRLGGFAAAGAAAYLIMLCRYGIGELFSWRRPGRLLLFLCFVIVAMLGGFRSTLIMFLLTFGILFYLEGLTRSPLLPALLVVTLLAGAATVPLIGSMPLSIQRSLSFLPLPVDPMVKAVAQASNEWRVEMWKHVLPQVPEYLILGKGYSFTAKDLAMTRLATTPAAAAEGAELAGDYHNGPLSVILPFGIPGVIAFLWFWWGCWKVLRQNYLFGDTAFHRVNTFLLAYFLAKAVGFLFIFGGLYSDLASFTGLVALSVSINGGMARKPAVAQPKIVLNRFKLQPPRPVSA